MLRGVADEYGDRQAFLLDIDDELYLTIGAPFRISIDPDDAGSQLVGSVMVAEPLENLLRQVKENTVALRVTVYGLDGKVLATTLGEDEAQREALAISPAFFQAIIADTARTFQLDRTILGRHYRFAYFVFLIRHRALGVMSLGIDSGFVTETGAWGRVQLAAVFGFSMHPRHGDRLHPNVGCRVTAWETDLMRTRRALRFSSEVDEKVLVELHSAVCCIAVDLCHPRTLVGHLGIELVVPDTVQRAGDIEPLAVAAQLQHLRPACNTAIVEFGLAADQPTEPDLAGQSRF